MNRTLIHKTCGKSIVMICTLLLMQTSLAWTAEDITGDWKITMNMEGRESFASLSIAKKADGTLTGKWGSSELSNVKFENDKLTFVRKISFGDQEFTMDYSGTLKDGKLTGTLSSDMGDIPSVGVRKAPKSPALGRWDVNFKVMDQDISASLIVSQTKEGALEGKWTSEPGEHKISNLKFQDGKISFTRNSKIEELEFASSFEGTIKGDELTGTMKSEMGDIPVSGKRFGTALIGTWELTTTSDFGTMTNMMVIDGDMTGSYESFGGEAPMKDLKLEGNQLTFKLELGFGEMTFNMDFKGTMDGKTIKGQMNSDRGTSEVKGKKLEKTTPAVTTPSAPAGKAN